MENMTFRSGKYAGVALSQIPTAYLEWAYVNLEAMSPQTRNQAGLEVTRRHGCPSQPLASATRRVEARRRQPAPDLAEELFAVLEYYAGGRDGDMARDVLNRLCGKVL